MIQAAIIGAGQLGSRHLQGLVKSKNKFTINVVDPCDDSLKTAELRSKEIKHEHKILFHSSITELPKSLDFVIIATNADVRLRVLESLVNHSSVETLVLEKVLFQYEEAYYRALELIEVNGIKCYVNHPRRSQGIYQSIKAELDKFSDTHFDIDVFGVNWGLGCNGLHVTDLIEYLFSDNINSYAIDELDQNLLPSKRNGFKEFTGSIKGMTKRGHSFRITSCYSPENMVKPISVTLNSSKVRFWISEAGMESVYIREIIHPEIRRDMIKLEQIKLQSDLTGSLIDLALLGENLPLTKYEHAMKNHLKFINALLEQINRITNINTEICPIT